jgi:perosamine synthetase
MEQNKRKIPWAQPVLRGNEKKYVEQALTSTWISGGPFVERLEKEFAEYCGNQFALAASNGSTALHMAYLALGLGPGDEVIVPGFCFLAAANIALHVGAKPVFAEVDSETWCLTASAVEKCITEKTKVIVSVHTYGNMCQMDTILDLAKLHHIAVVEDAAEAFASRYKGCYAGTFGEIGTFSLHATKTVTTGEGGMVITNDKNLLQKMKLFQSHGMLRKKYYWHELPGHNFRLTNLQAGIGCAQMEQLASIIRERKRIHKQYKLHLEKVTEIVLQYFSMEVDPVLWAMTVKLDNIAYPQGRDIVITAMKDLGIETRPGFYTPRNFYYLQSAILPTCEEISTQTISLPTFCSLTDEQIEFICQQLIKLKR